jgi:hypothetical protein
MEKKPLTPAEAELVKRLNAIIRRDAEANGMSEREWVGLLLEEAEREVYGCTLYHEYDASKDKSLERA